MTGDGPISLSPNNHHICIYSNIPEFLPSKPKECHLRPILCFKEEVFGELRKCPEMLKSKGECIARNCDGLPLAIAVAGNSLVVSSSTEAANSLTVKWWKAVSENVIMHVTDYGDGLRVLERLESSYSELTPRMQECFLYLGVFPEGHEIRVQTLVRLWIAKGLLHDLAEILKNMQCIFWVKLRFKDLQSLEETVEKYLHDLVDRNLVMVVKRYTDSHIKTRRLHKVVYAFYKYKAGEKDFKQGIEMTGDGPVSLSPNNHRLCIYSISPTSSLVNQGNANYVPFYVSRRERRLSWVVREVPGSTNGSSFSGFWSADASLSKAFPTS